MADKYSIFGKLPSLIHINPELFTRLSGLIKSLPFIVTTINCRCIAYV